MNLATGRKTVAGVVAGLKQRRASEFMQSYADLPLIREILLVAIKDELRLEVWTRQNKSEPLRFGRVEPE